MKAERTRKPPPPLDEEALERLGLLYAGRCATTRAKLSAYLGRKLRERGWAGRGEPRVEHLVERFAGLGYVDDRAFASAKAASLMRRGYGERRVDQALKAAGVAAGEAQQAQDGAREQALAAALRFAERRRIGPYAEVRPERETLQKAAAAMLRAGHRIEIIRRVLDSSPGEVPDPDSL